MSAALSRPSTVPSDMAVPLFNLRLASPAPDQAIPSALWPVAGKHIYMIGIGGSGMQGLARLLASRGAIVSGSDNSPSHVTQGLIDAGMSIDFNQATAALPDGTSIVIASAAITEDHPQMKLARKLSTTAPIEIFNYAQALGRSMQGQTAICIAGTHGKSTTTSMTTALLCDAGLAPTGIVGATCQQLAGSLGPRKPGQGFVLGQTTIPSSAPAGLAGAPGILVAESCEFNRSFHNYQPTLAVITSVEADHLDIYGTLEAVIESFAVFARKLPSADEGGLLLIAHENAHRREVTAGVKAAVETIGFNPEADWVVTFNAVNKRASVSHARRNLKAEWQSQIPGAHNASNAACAAAIALVLGVDPALISKSLSAFAGVDRRSQVVGHWKADAAWTRGVKVYDDYGHHPTEVSVTLRALRQFEKPEDRGGRLICVFQPHQHSRTRHLLAEFAAAFDDADLVIVPEIYFVRDAEIEKTLVTSADLVDKLRDRNIDAMHVYPFPSIVKQLQLICKPGDVVVVMGAGPVNQVAYQFVSTSK
jgi:UDP-N-acetylmuramate--alanine ligase